MTILHDTRQNGHNGHPRLQGDTPRTFFVPLVESELNAALIASPGTFAEICGQVHWSDFGDARQHRIARAIWEVVQNGLGQHPPVPASQAITYGAIQSYDPELDRSVLRPLDDLATENVIFQAPAHAQTIRRMAQARRAWLDLNQGLHDMIQRPVELPNILAGIQRQLSELRIPLMGRVDSSLRAALMLPQDEIQQGMQTGFLLFDSHQTMGGLQPGKIMLLVGAEKGRKSTLAHQMVLRFAMNRIQGTYYTYDGTWLDVMNSLIAKLATAIMIREHAPAHELRLRLDQLHPSRLTEWQRQAVAAAREQLMAVSDSLWIVDKKSGIGDIDGLEQEIVRGAADRGDRYVVIDYLQDISHSQVRTEREALNHVVQRLDRLARERNLASIWISQRSAANNTRAAEEIASGSMPTDIGTKESKKPAEACDFAVVVAYNRHENPDWIWAGFWGGRLTGGTPYHAMQINPTSGLITTPQRMPDWMRSR